MPKMRFSQSSTNTRFSRPGSGGKPSSPPIKCWSLNSPQFLPIRSTARARLRVHRLARVREVDPGGPLDGKSAFTTGSHIAARQRGDRSGIDITSFRLPEPLSGRTKTDLMLYPAPWHWRARVFITIWDARFDLVARSSTPVIDR